jgi:NADH-quinone oxidoreductase subunit M
MNALITAMLIAPVFGIFAQLFSFNQSAQRQGFGKSMGIGSSLISSVLGIFLVSSLGADLPGSEFREVFPWIGGYAISYDMMLDGANALGILLISIVFPVIFVSEWNRKEGVHGLYALFLLLQVSLLGMICAQDLFLFFVFLALSSLPFYFLTALWGGKDRERAGFRYLMSASIGNGLIFGSVLLIYHSVFPHSFSILELSGGRVEESALAPIGFLLLCIGFGLRLPIWPLHGWFSFLMTQAPASVGVALVGVFVPVTLIAFIRVVYFLFPLGLSQFGYLFVTLGLFNVLYSALCAVIQRDLRRVTAFLCMVQIGLILVGTGSLNHAGLVGAIYQGFSAGIALSGFALFYGLLHEKVGHTYFIEKNGEYSLGGLIKKTPLLALAVGLFICSLLGFPGVTGFVGQSLILMGGFAVHPLINALIGIGLLILIYAMFSVYRLVFLGVSGFESEKMKDLSAREKAYLYPLLVAMIFFGIFPSPLVKLMTPPVELLMGMLP